MSKIKRKVFAYRAGLKGNCMRAASLRSAHQAARIKSTICTKNVYVLSGGKIVTKYKNGYEVGGTIIVPARCLNCNEPLNINSGRGRKRHFCKPSCGVEYRERKAYKRRHYRR